MTDRIDLDGMDVESDDDPDANRGDWFWRGEGDPEAEPDEGWLDDGADTAGDRGANADEAGARNADEERDREPVPGVPRANRDRPVGVPVEGGGAGGAAAGAGDTDGETVADRVTADGSADDPGDATPAASGPHGGGVDDMTMALTYDAAQRLADPRFAVIDAKGWADWIGIVGDVPAHEINRFQRDHAIDADFFNGAGQEPAERLADVDEHSMFYAERMVLVGVDGERPLAERAGWEFVPLETAAEKAGWDLSDPA